MKLYLTACDYFYAFILHLQTHRPKGLQVLCHAEEGLTPNPRILDFIF